MDAKEEVWLQAVMAWVMTTTLTTPPAVATAQETAQTDVKVTTNGGKLARTGHADFPERIARGLITGGLTPQELALSLVAACILALVCDYLSPLRFFC